MGVVNVITIDGPSGSGKSSAAKALAEKLGILYIDTGAMFRALAWFAVNYPERFDESRLEQVLAQLRFEYAPRPGVLVEVEGHDVTLAIREHQISEKASEISKLPAVRAYLLAIQRSLATEKIMVMEGRDIGTVIFPQAFCKFFITAGTKVRAERRLEQLRSLGNQEITLAEVKAAVKQRDERDRQRDIAPMVKAEDAIEIDTAEMSLDEVVEKMARIARTRASESGLSL